MNKNLIKIVATALTITAVSGVMPASNFDFAITKAYAASGDLTSIKLEESNGGKIKIYSDDDYKNRNKVDDDELDKNETYYARTSAKKIEIDTEGVNSSHVRIFKSKRSSTKGEKPNEAISLYEGSTTTLIIRTYDKDPGSVKYDDNSYTSEYTIKVKSTSSDSDENDDVYLDSLSLNNGKIDFNKNHTSYDISVNKSVNEVKITANPEDEDDTVEINGYEVDYSDDYERTVNLDKGKNEIEIKVTDDDDNSRTYTLNINSNDSSKGDNYLDYLEVNGSEINLSSGESSYTYYTEDESIDVLAVKAFPKDNNDTVKINGYLMGKDYNYERKVNLNKGNNNFEIKVNDDNGNGKSYKLNIVRGKNANNNTNTTNATIKPNQWIIVNGQWQYNDSLGKSVKNTWVQNYYLKADGNMATYWLSIGGYWYYFGGDGAMKTGWQYVNGSWYYLDYQGKMLTGWFKDINGKWYYLYSGSGAMAANTTINGYKVDYNGVWVR